MTSLDAVRGIAACVVVISHCYQILPREQRLDIDGTVLGHLFSPFHNGDAAVIIFFILSGYVLTLPYLRGAQLSYPTYVIRRICRIYLPFVAMILIALLLYCITGQPHVAEASDWFNTLWPSERPSLVRLARHLLMIGTEQDMTLSPIMWTLIYEMRISLLFPLLVILCRDTRVAIIVALAMLVGCTKVIVALGEPIHPSHAQNFGITVLWTIRIMPYFITGILLSKHREQIHRLWNRMPTIARFGFLAAPFVILVTIHHDFFVSKTDALYDLGAAILVVAAIEVPGLQAFLNEKIPQWLGRISYSTYLIHPPILLVVTPILVGVLPFIFVASAVMAASLAAATLMYVLVEASAIKLGQRLTRTPTLGAGGKAEAPEAVL